MICIQSATHFCGEQIRRIYIHQGTVIVGKRILVGHPILSLVVEGSFFKSCGAILEQISQTRLRYTFNSITPTMEKQFFIPRYSIWADRIKEIRIETEMNKNDMRNCLDNGSGVIILLSRECSLLTIAKITIEKYSIESGNLRCFTILDLKNIEFR